eukprot:Nk52_evm13s2273 gene=Nk52_evmTU13s2273
MSLSVKTYFIGSLVAIVLASVATCEHVRLGDSTELFITTNIDNDFSQKIVLGKKHILKLVYADHECKNQIGASNVSDHVDECLLDAEKGSYKLATPTNDTKHKVHDGLKTAPQTVPGRVYAIHFPDNEHCQGKGTKVQLRELVKTTLASRKLDVCGSHEDTVFIEDFVH